MVRLINFSWETELLWKKILSSSYFQAPFYTYQWHKLWYNHFGKNNTYYLLLINNDCIAPLIKIDDTIQFSGGKEIADYMDIFAAEKGKEVFWLEIISYVKKIGIKKIQLFNIPQSSETYNFFKKNPSASITKEDTTPCMKLPDSWENYINSLTRKHRHEIQRKIRKFESQHEEISFKVTKNSQNDISDALALMQLNQKKNIFFTQSMVSFFQALPNTFLDQLDISILDINKQRAAALVSFTMSNTVYLYNSGFDEINFSGAGFYIKAMHIKSAIERGFKNYNFLQGSERYKYELGGKDFFVYNIEMSL